DGARLAGSPPPRQAHDRSVEAPRQPGTVRGLDRPSVPREAVLLHEWEGEDQAQASRPRIKQQAGRYRAPARHGDISAQQRVVALRREGYDRAGAGVAVASRVVQPHALFAVVDFQRELLEKIVTQEALRRPPARFADGSERVKSDGVGPQPQATQPEERRVGKEWRSRRSP